MSSSYRLRHLREELSDCETLTEVTAVVAHLCPDPDWISYWEKWWLQRYRGSQIVQACLADPWEVPCDS